MGWPGRTRGRLWAAVTARSVTLEVTDAALEIIAKRGYDPTFGARPIKRRDVEGTGDNPDVPSNGQKKGRRKAGE